MPSILFRPKPKVEKTPTAPKASPLCCGSQNQLTKSTNMSTALNNNSTRSTVPGTVAISDDEMRRFAPSVFASQPIEGVSQRYMGMGARSDGGMGRGDQSISAGRKHPRAVDAFLAHRLSAPVLSHTRDGP